MGCLRACYLELEDGLLKVHSLLCEDILPFPLNFQVSRSFYLHANYNALFWISGTMTIKFPTNLSPAARCPQVCPSPYLLLLPPEFGLLSTCPQVSIVLKPKLGLVLLLILLIQTGHKAMGNQGKESSCRYKSQQARCMGTYWCPNLPYFSFRTMSQGLKPKTSFSIQRFCNYLSPILLPPRN